MTADARTVTDLETTALAAMVKPEPGTVFYSLCQESVAAVRELARRAEQWQKAHDTAAKDWRELDEAATERMWAVLARAEAAEADRDRIRAEWQREAERDHAAFANLTADRDRLQAENETLLANIKAEAIQTILAKEYGTEQFMRADRYREALEQVAAMDSPFGHSRGAFREIARAALATPDTPPGRMASDRVRGWLGEAAPDTTQEPA